MAVPIVETLNQIMPLVQMFCTPQRPAASASYPAAPSPTWPSNGVEGLMDEYFCAVADGRRPMPHGLKRILDAEHEHMEAVDARKKAAHDGDGAPAEKMERLSLALDAVRNASNSNALEQKMKEHFADLTTEEKTVIRELATDTSFSRHAEKIGMSREKFTEIYKHLGDKAQ